MVRSLVQGQVGLGFGVEGLRFRVWGLGFRLQDLGFGNLSIPFLLNLSIFDVCQWDKTQVVRLAALRYASGITQLVSGTDGLK